MAKLYTQILECNGECGAKIEVTLRNRNNIGNCHSIAEALGWTTRDPKDKRRTTEVYCEHCQTLAKRIVGETR